MSLQALCQGEDANEAADLEHGEGKDQGEALPEKEEGNHVSENGGEANHDPLPKAKPTAAKSMAAKPKKNQGKKPSKKKTQAWPKTMTLEEVEKSLHSAGTSLLLYAESVFEKK